MTRQRVHQTKPDGPARAQKSRSASVKAPTPAQSAPKGQMPVPSWSFANLPVSVAPVSANAAAGDLTRAWPGFNFSDVRIDTSGSATERAASRSVPAYAEGRTIGLAPGFEPHSGEGRHALAHELAHVVQQERGLTRGMNSGSRASLEADAEQNAQLALAGKTVQLPPRVGPAAEATQGFDPEYHEKAITGGLTGIFNPDEIGKMYEANWKRDFSQGPAIIADIVLTWKELKRYADQHGGQSDSGLQFKLAKLVALLPNRMAFQAHNTYGGYQYWEHMDNPGAAAAAESDQRWGTGPGELPGYIRDSRASIKDKLTAGIQAARDSWGGLKADSGKSRADAWARGAPPANYDMSDPYAGRTKPPQGYGVAQNVPDPGTSSSVVASEVTGMASQMPGAKTGAPTRGFASDPAVADNLGRASHLIEDFFAHSNFVELALSLKMGNPILPSDLRTGTFEGADQAHSLAGKLRDASEDIKAHKELIPLVAGTIISTLDAVSATAEMSSQKMGVKPGSHTQMAKDNPHAGQDFPMALELATRADEMIFWYVRKIMQKPSPDSALDNINVLYMLVDAIINIPSDTHPLKNVYAPKAASQGAP